MNRLTKFIAPALAASLALGSALPATAAGWNGNASGVQLRQQIAQLDRKIDQAESRHQLSRDEARKLDASVSQIQRLHATYSRGGLTRAEVRTLNTRIDTVERQLAREIADRDNRGDRDNRHNGFHG